MEKSYLEIKVTFHHILILLVGVILIGSFLFYLGYQAGKTALTSQEQKLLLAKGESKTKEIESLAAIKKEPVKIEESGTGGAGNTGGTDTETTETPSIEDELKLHQQPTADTSTGTGGTSSAPPAKTTETKTVNPKTEEPKVEEIKTAKPAKKSQYFAIQVGAFNSHVLAKDYSNRFSRAGYAISISQAEVKGKTWYRVRVGSFETRDEAQKEKTKLEKLENKKFSVVKAE